MTFTPKDWVNGPGGGTPLNATGLEDLETRVSDYTDLRAPIITPLEYGAVGDGSTDDSGPIQDALDAMTPGSVLEFGGLTYKVDTFVQVNDSNVILQNGKLLGDDNRTLIVADDDVTVQNMRFERGTGGADTLTSSELSNVVVNGEGFRSLNCDYTDAALACLLLSAAAASGARVVGGTMTNSAARQNACLLMSQASGTADSNVDMVIDGVVGVGAGCSDGIVLFDVSYCTVVNCHLSGMAELPRLTMTGWTATAGGVYSTPDRTDGDTRVLFNNGVQMTEETVTPTTPTSGEWGVSAGVLYAHVGGADPDTRTMQSRIVSGYGIQLYNDTPAQIDCYLGHNQLRSVDGIGIYMVGTGEGNKTDHNILRDVCTSGTQTVSLPFAGIGISTLTDITLSGDSIDTTGTCPGVLAINSATGKAQGLDIRAAGEQGFIAQTGTWQVSNCRARACGATGFLGNANVTFTDCDADNTPLQTKWNDGILNVQGAGDPVATITARIGSVYRRTDGGASTTLYVKESGTDATGWVAK